MLPLYYEKLNNVSHSRVYLKSFNNMVLIYHDFINRCGGFYFTLEYNRLNDFSISTGTILKTKKNILIELISTKKKSQTIRNHFVKLETS